MKLELIELRQGSADRCGGSPFEASDRFRHFDAWDRVRYSNDNHWYIKALINGVEVGRADMDEVVHLQEYGVDPDTQSKALEIQLIEVSSDHRLQGIARQILQQLSAQHPDRILVAFSEQADEFWSSMGWRRYDHPAEPRNRPLFVQY